MATDYFVASKAADPETSDKFIEAMASQLRAADSATLLEIARKLAPCSRAPARVLSELISADSEAGNYLLEHAVAFTGLQLAQAVAFGGERRLAVAKRRDLNPRLASLLAVQGEAAVLVALARNSAARLEGAVLQDLFARARRMADEEGDRQLADALLEREPAWPECASLFLVARPDQRIEILLAAQRSQLGHSPNCSVPIDPASLDELELAAVARQPERFVALLAEALDCGQALARKIVDDPTGEPLVVALTALGAADAVLVRILISNDLLSGATFRRIGALARLNNALSLSAAGSIMKALRTEPDTIRRRGRSASSNPGLTRSRSFPSVMAKIDRATPWRVLSK